MKKRMIAGMVLVALGGMSVQGLQVTDVAFEQDRQTYRMEVDYTLVSDGPALVRLDVLTNGVSIGMENIKSLDGDVSRNFSTFVEPGRRRLRLADERFLRRARLLHGGRYFRRQFGCLVPGLLYL